MRIRSLFILASLILVLAACSTLDAAPPTAESFSSSPTTTQTTETEETITPVDIISTRTVVIEASATPIPTETMTPPASQTPTPEATATLIYTPTLENTPTQEATLTKTPLPTNTKVPSRTPKPTNTLKPTNTIVPTKTPRPTPTETAKPTPFIYPDLVLNKTTEYPDFANFFSEQKGSISENKIPFAIYYLGDNPNTLNVETPRVGWLSMDKKTLSSNISEEDFQLCLKNANLPFNVGWDNTNFWKRPVNSAWHFHRYTDKTTTPWKVKRCEWENKGIDATLKQDIIKFDKGAIPNLIP